jgi:Activator of Hsp90 ATPase homolog 1-like protein
VFTEGIGRWWPIAGHSVHGAGGTVAFTGGQIVEQSATGQQIVWGTVTRWEPPAAVAFTWHPGRTPERPSHVEVTFTAAGPQNLVTLIHSGWEAYADPAAMRAEYDHGWPAVLGHYQEHAGLPGAEGGPGEAGGLGCARQAISSRPGR